jgi:predicted acetyltransferase
MSANRTTPDPPGVALEPIPVDAAPVLQNLFELYVHDFSEYLPVDLRPDGRFDVAVGERWWTSEGHHPFFIRSGGKLCGFALARRGSGLTGAPDVMDVAEFFVVRGARRKNVGTGAAHTLFATFPGPWEVRVRRANVPAARFWSRAAASWLGRPAPSDPWVAEGVDWDVLRVAAR